MSAVNVLIPARIHMCPCPALLLRAVCIERGLGRILETRVEKWGSKSQYLPFESRVVESVETISMGTVSSQPGRGLGQGRPRDNATVHPMQLSRLPPLFHLSTVESAAGQPGGLVVYHQRLRPILQVANLRERCIFLSFFHGFEYVLKLEIYIEILATQSHFHSPVTRFVLRSIPLRAVAVALCRT